MLRFGIHSLALTPLWDPAEADRLLPAVRSQGASLLEIPLLDPVRFDSAGTKAVAEVYDMRVVCSLGLPDYLDVLKNPEDVVDFLSLVLEAANRAGAGAVSGVTYGTIGKTSGSPVTGAESDAVCRVVSRVAGRAGKLGMRLGIEPCNRYETHLLNTAAQAVGIIERTGAGNLFIHLDTYHMNIEEEGIAKGFADAGEHLGYVHLSESNRGVPGRGNIDWEETFSGLKQVDYDGPLTLESFVHLAPELASGLAVWRPVTDRPADVIEVGFPFLWRHASAAGLEVAR